VTLKLNIIQVSWSASSGTGNWLGLHCVHLEVVITPEVRVAVCIRLLKLGRVDLQGEGGRKM
jgi:hypothetical protein